MQFLALLLLLAGGADPIDRPSAADLDDGLVAPGAVWGFNPRPVRVANLSEFSRWAPTYGDSHGPDRIGYLVFGR